MRRQSVLRAEERKHCSRVMDQAACDAVWGTTSNRLGAETAARTGIPEQARKHPSRGKVARGRSELLVESVTSTHSGRGPASHAYTIGFPAGRVCPRLEAGRVC